MIYPSTYRLNRSIITVAYTLLFFGSVSASGGSGMTIVIDNNTTSDLLVTAYDLNASSVQKVLSSEKINSFASISVAINPDESGRGHLSWTAISATGDPRTCGKADNIGLSDSDTVHVSANSACGSR
jgi:hypothetical protein